MKKISRKLWYVLLMVVVISGMLLFIPGSLYACIPNTLTVTVHKAIDGTGFGVFSFELWVGDESNAPSVKFTNTIPAEGGTCTLTWTDSVSDTMATVYVVESGNGGATSTFWGSSDPASTPGDTTSTFVWDRFTDMTQDVYFKNVIPAPTPTDSGAPAPGPVHGSLTLVKTNSLTGSLVEGAEYWVYDITGAHYENLITDSDGSAVLSGFDFGTYTVKEFKEALGYMLDPTIYTVTFSPSNTNITLNIQDTPVSIVTVAALTEETAEEETAEEEAAEVVEVAAAEVIEVAAITELPRTGNNMLFYVIGFALMAVGVAFGSFFIPKALRKREN